MKKVLFKKRLCLFCQNASGCAAWHINEL